MTTTDQQVLDRAKKAIVDNDADQAKAIARAGVDGTHDPLTLMQQGFIPGIQAVGELFGRGELFLPELMLTAQTMSAVTEILNQALAGEGTEDKGAILVATVKGDVHDIGKSIVISLLKANGFTVHDLGRDVAVDRIIEAAVDLKVDLIGTSALLTTTMGEQKTLEERLREKGLRDRFKTLVGGAPVTARWAAKIGADAYAEDAQDGVVKAARLLGLS